MINKISVVVSVYNEEAVLDQFKTAVMDVLDSIICDYELIFVNDGSRDASIGILERFALENPKIKIVNFSKNFGHESAMIAGVDYSTGDGIICMDSDLQHPVECIPDIIDKFNEGYDIVSMVRTANKSAGKAKNITSDIFYKLLNSISDVHFENNASDFFAIARKPATILRKHFRESKRFLRAYVQNIGFKKTVIEYEAKERAAGESKYSLKKLFNFSISALISFSDLPLKISSFFGGIGTVACILLIIYTIYTKIRFGTPNGYATMIVVMCVMFTILFFLLGIIGEYLAVMLAEIRKRPIYIVKDLININEEEKEDHERIDTEIIQ